MMNIKDENGSEKSVVMEGGVPLDTIQNDEAD